MKKKLYIKRKILRIFNIGVIGSELFSDKKNIQLYNIFLFFCFFIVLIFAFLLLLFKYFYNAFFVISCAFAFVIAYYLNSKKLIYWSKVFIIQFTIILFTVSLIFLTSESIFNIYYFIGLLYTTIIFNDNEVKTKIFFIIQSIIGLFVFLTPTKYHVIVMELTPITAIKNLNIISIFIFILYLFLYIFFQTRFQTYKEDRFHLLNLRLLKNNKKIIHQNTQKKLNIAITSFLLNTYFEKYENLFNIFCNELNQSKPNQKMITSSFTNLQSYNSKIESIINYHFSDYKSIDFLELEEVEIHEKIDQIAKRSNKKITIITEEKKYIQINKDLFDVLMFEILKKIDTNHTILKVKIEINTNSDRKKETIFEKYVEIMGILIVYKFEGKKNIDLTLCFFNSTDNKEIYRLA